ncbi:MAG: glycosyltransferase [Bacillota bacterium]
MNNENPLISIILPVYGVEDYLDCCINSLVNQTYKNLEILLIDDGSIDRSPEIIDTWAEKDTRISAVHKQNGGQSSARNLGLDIMKGEYVTFVDSDDWVEENYIRALYEAITSCDGDISIVGISKVKDKQVKYSKFYKEDRVCAINYCSANDALKYFFETSIAVWAKMYKSSLWDDIRFPDGRLAEEYVVLLNILKNVNCVVFNNQHLYNYRIRQDSDSHSIKPQYVFDNILAISNALTICSTSFNQYTQWCQQRLAMLLYQFLAAQKYGESLKYECRKDIVYFLDQVGGQNELINSMESPLDSIIYSYVQFKKYLLKSEIKKLQKDFRKKICFNDFINTSLPKKIKYLLAYLNLRFYTLVCRFVKS